MKKNYKEILPQITTFIFDVDGVLTDSTVLLLENGELVRHMSVRDGFAIKTALDNGFNVAIISGGTSMAVQERLKNLGVKDIYLKVFNKLEVFKEYCDMYSIESKNILYMGDDLPDLEVMKKVGLATAPQDAVSEILQVADYVSHKNGGKGCVRDVIEQVLKVHGKWQTEDVKTKFG
jgi:3-deoxy-D-manno-octulosonate 8-phosphate phosphatase (KDO 8-P phosphatase)